MAIIVQKRVLSRTAPALRRADRPVITARQAVATEPAFKPDAATAAETAIRPALVDQGPYLDYSRSLTPVGGVLIIYKDLDLRWRQLVWKASAWSTASGAEAWYLQAWSPLDGVWLNLLAWLAVAALNLWIVWQSVEVYRRLEVRPDGLILDGDEVFWREHLAGDGPSFQPDDDGNLILGGVYGTRFVEFATLRRFDEFDRLPEAFMGHFEEAVGQLWT